MATKKYVKWQLEKIRVGETIYPISIKIAANGNGQDTNYISLTRESAQVIVKWLQDNFINNKPEGK